MKKLSALAILLMALSACDGDGTNPLDEEVEEPADDSSDDPTDDDVVDDETIDLSGTGNLQAVTFDAATETLTLVMSGLDGDDLEQEYTRDAQYDIAASGDNNGYIAFTTQDDGVSRFYTAYVAESSDGSVIGAVAADGGQYGYFFGGVLTEQIDDYTAPTSGLVSYTGGYIGLVNIGTQDGVEVADGLPTIAEPYRSGQISGDVILHASFSDMQTEGAIFNRVDVDGVGIDTSDLILVVTDIDEDGSFASSVETIDGGTRVEIGAYSGTFGGEDASSVAGGINISDFDENFELEEEFGIFVLDQCGDSTSDICAAADDLGE